MINLKGAKSAISSRESYHLINWLSESILMLQTIMLKAIQTRYPGPRVDFGVLVPSYLSPLASRVEARYHQAYICTILKALYMLLFSVDEMQVLLEQLSRCTGTQMIPPSRKSQHSLLSVLLCILYPWPLDRQSAVHTSCPVRVVVSIYPSLCFIPLLLD